MTPMQIELVQSSFGKVAPIAPTAARLFYDRLFATVPEVRPLFKGDIDEQGRKLMATLATVVNNLHRLDSLMPTVTGLAVRHVDYGVRPEHYASVGAALLWTLEQGLGTDFTAEVAEAWRAAYGALSGAMIRAAYPVGATS